MVAMKFLNTVLCLQEIHAGIWKLQDTSSLAHLPMECESVIWWYMCRNVKAVMALDLKLSFSATIFSMRLRSDTVNLHWPIRMSSSVDVRLHSSSVTLAARWRQLRLTQDRCFGWIWWETKKRWVKRWCGDGLLKANFRELSGITKSLFHLLQWIRRCWT